MLNELDDFPLIIVQILRENRWSRTKSNTLYRGRAESSDKLILAIEISAVTSSVIFQSPSTLFRE